MERPPLAGFAIVAAGIAIWYFLSEESSTASGDTEGEMGGTMDLGNITQDRSTWPAGDPIWAICQAVAHAEGYDRGPGAAPFNLNNPGDLSPGDEHGQATAGPAEYHGGSYVIHFASPAAGWTALYRKFSNIAEGKSGTYSATWDWLQIGRVYAQDANWTLNVTRDLGVDPTSTMQQYLDQFS